MFRQKIWKKKLIDQGKLIFPDLETVQAIDMEQKKKLIDQVKLIFPALENVQSRDMAPKNNLIKENLFFLLWNMFRQETWHQKIN